MRRRFALALCLAAGAFACAGRTTTSANTADAATGGQGLADGGAPGTAAATDASICNIERIAATSYDQACEVDTDCVAIVEGNACDPCVFDSAFNAAINSGAVAKYNSDIANTPGAVGIRGAGCSTGGGTVSGNGNWGPLCCSGACQVGSQCPSAVDASTCQWPAGLNDVGPGACAVGRALVKCDYPSGGGCICISDDPTSCAGCAGATCTTMCAPNEYAVSCGGPPQVFTYQQAPAACVGMGGTPAGNAYSCCPCE